MAFKRRIALIIPPYRISERFGLPYPMGIGYIGTVLKQNGHKVKIFDCDAMQIGMKELRRILNAEKPDVVGITATSYTRFSAINVAKMAKEFLPDCVTVVGGPHFTATAEDALRVVKEVDFVVRGEGEYAMLELLDGLSGRLPFEDIGGLSFRKNGNIILNPGRKHIADIDTIPVLDRDLIDSSLYFERLPHSDIECKSVLASRGCPFSCSFCFPHDRSYRRRSNSKILDEVEYLIKRYNVEAIRFFDLTFTVSPDNVKDFCRQIKERKIEFKWYCESRVDIDLSLLELMREAGCYSLDFGLESASPRVLEQIHKRISPQQALAFAKCCNSLGIRTKVFLMLSLPGEDINDAGITYGFACELSQYVTALGLQVTQIIPGTEVERRAKELKIIPDGFSWNSPFRSKRTRTVAGCEEVPLYMEKLSYTQIMKLYRAYSIFDIYSIKKITFSSFLDKLRRGLTNWDKGIFFKIGWLMEFLRAGIFKLLRHENR